MSSAVDYSKERILIIDDMPAARASVAYLARMAGATQVDTAASYQDAIARIRSGPKPGIVLCDYHLGEGRTGQQLLDELVHTNLIGPETVFIMITAEGAPGHVVAAAELAPDDYLLKPLKAALLAERLQKQVIRKRTLAQIVRFQKEGKDDRAMAEIDALLSQSRLNPPVLRFQLLRIKAEMLLQAGAMDRAEGVLQSLPANYSAPWVSFLRAQIQVRRGQLDAALVVLQEVCDKSPNFLAARELLAEILLKKGEGAQAQKILEAIVSVNPLNWQRQQLLSEVAMGNGDVDRAHQAAQDYTKHVLPVAIGRGERLQMARVFVAAGEMKRAATMLEQLIAEGGLCAETRLSVVALYYVSSPDKEKAEAFTKVREDCLGLAPGKEDVGVDIIRASLAVGDFELAERMVENLLGNSATAKAFVRIRPLFIETGNEDLFKRAKKQAAHRLIGKGVGPGLAETAVTR